ncbi:nitroimidazol reductase NimA-like FMN-containing flavoprotein (pyridoxamine 5'-phosphate oxidase superfamily) [Arthrobacter stackebrandtii]|uniref:Nitroimidazol reductase NimA-like FMN-containing flavoprotein (Pyridoxamine 5'-phosphate oxidase superfamily) n=1 Tax=Arthrobacter stackebrandtii TaxID=272161 RepID=A0ABS4Z2L9_9MICC|nr:pyridoxamine 5'-phosphate oxidase family protein [Arthrobacter stackebrandtii]MBP2414508.1 nitroimidazol reductase NimA-like FMN-containing flavoprotein (pyridoxamine 5'-phosphate oxidase superfamily) [Arthrobacter stackebrandtii]PYH01625.1 pyridoxamine 5'-phosphate oxidase [Arthrobacter stackebrandtii]
MTTEEQPGQNMTTEDAWRFLEHTRFGRLALSVANEPDIFPINYLAHDGKLLMRTNPGTKLAELTINSSVAFEIDGLAEDEAWSVVLKGTARVLESQREIDAAIELPLAPWLKTLKYTFVEITPTSVRGVRFKLGSEPERY